MIRLGYLCLVLYCSLPATAAAIELSEIAWMGSADSANHEWIELYSPEVIDVTGWVISDDSNLQIELSGTINAGQYAVLERTSDASAPGSAWGIYTGSLVNTGATLTLYDETGGVVDRVVGGDGWERVGGDNTTKATAQLSATGWQSATPTPGGPIATMSSAEVSANDDEPAAESTKSSQSAAASTKRTSASVSTTKLTLPDVTLALAVSAPSTAYVNQPIDFQVTPSGVGHTIAQSLQYVWNFGDTNTASAAKVRHAYSHPGNYVVVVEGSYKRQVQRARHEVVVLPVSLSLTKLDTGDIAIQNTSQIEIDLTKYRLVGDREFVIPDYTIVLPQSQIVIEQDKFQTTNVPQMIVLYDQARQQVATHLPAHLTPTTATAQHPSPDPLTRPTPRISAIDDSPRYMFAAASSAPAPTSPKPADEVGTATRPVPAVASVGSASLPAAWPIYALVGLLLLAIAAVYLIPRTTKDEAPFA